MILLSEREQFELYIAWRRLSTAFWRFFPLAVFARWLMNKHPRWAIPFASALGASMIALMLTDGTWTHGNH